MRRRQNVILHKCLVDEMTRRQRYIYWAVFTLLLIFSLIITTFSTTTPLCLTFYVAPKQDMKREDSRQQCLYETTKQAANKYLCVGQKTL